MNVENGKFACDACGKRYTWKPQLAGKKAKCSCGASMVVPTAEAPAAETGDTPDDLYDFADPIPAAKPARPMPAAAVATAPAVQAAQPSKAIGYRSAPTKDNTAKDRFSYDAMTQPARDLYVPVALIVLALLGILAYGVYIGADAFMIAVVSLVTGVATVIKMAILIALAFWIAPLAGISFGELRTALLKFAAIVLFADAVDYWFDEVLESVGEIRGDKRTIRSIFYAVAMMATVITVLSYYLFDMDKDEVATFAVPFALASYAAGWIFNLVALAVIGALVATAAAPPPAPPVPGPTAPAPATPGASAAPAAPAAPAGPTLQATPRDREIERLIGSGSRMLTEANEYNQSQPQKGRREPALVGQFYGAGAKRVYIQMGGGRMVVQLPDDAAGRAKCFALSDQHYASGGAKGSPPKEEGQRFIEVELASAAR